MAPVLGATDCAWRRQRPFVCGEFVLVCCIFSGEAFAAWSWWSAYEAVAPTTKKLLPVNMDETAVRFFMPWRRGLLFSAARGAGRRKVVQRAPLKQQRTCVSRVAFLYAEPAAQPLLPQIILGSYHVLRLADVAAVQPCLPPNVFMFCRQSAWVHVPL